MSVNVTYITDDENRSNDSRGSECVDTDFRPDTVNRWDNTTTVNPSRALVPTAPINVNKQIVKVFQSFDTVYRKRFSQ
jgi:hypothetical protein